MTAIDIARTCGLQRASDVNPSLYQLREQGVLHFDQMAKNVKPLWSLRTWPTDFEAKNCSVTWAKPSKSHAAQTVAMQLVFVRSDWSDRPQESVDQKWAERERERDTETQRERERDTEREREQCWAMDISWFSTWVRVNKLSPKISMIYHQTYSNMKTYTGCSTPCLTQMMAALTSSCGIQRLRLCWGIGALERLHQRSHAECSDGGMRSPSGIQFEHKMKHEKYPGWMALIGSYTTWVIGGYEQIQTHSTVEKSINQLEWHGMGGILMAQYFGLDCCGLL